MSWILYADPRGTSPSPRFFPHTETAETDISRAWAAFVALPKCLITSALNMLDSMRMLNSDVKYAWADFLYLGSMEEMGDRIKQCRTLRGLTLDQVAEEIGKLAEFLKVLDL